jgi:S1-C subfamily serine protease
MRLDSLPFLSAYTSVVRLLSVTLLANFFAQAQTAYTAGAIYKQALPSVVSIEAYNDKGEAEWEGTGFIVATDGKLLTNYHVIRNSKQATVRLSNGDAYDTVEVMDVDERKDIALLKIKAVDLPALRVGVSSASQIGDPVYSVSNALGLGPNSLSEGIISGQRQRNGYRVLQVTAPISHGSSGGPLFNAKGEVIGITTFFLEEGQSLNFAVPIDYARGMLASPSTARPLESVYKPEKVDLPANAPPANAPQPSNTPQPTVVAASTAPNTTPVVPVDMQKNVGVFLGSKLLNWSEGDARNVMGEPLTHRNAYDPAQAIIGDIYNFADPTRAYQHIELQFDSKTKRLTNVYLYPTRLTWEECKRTWGDNITVKKNPDGSKFHLYKNRRLNIYLDKNDNVISLGLF